MSKHTPGPWKITAYSNTPAGRVIVSLENKFTDGYVIGGNCGVAEVERRGKCALDDARLIAAAPDLYDALKLAVARVELANEEGNPILSAWLPDAQTAIAKAEGREV